MFGVAESGAMLFEKLKISAGCETESQESGGQGFVTRKKGSPMEVTLTAILHSGLGLDVQKKAMELFSVKVSTGPAQRKKGAPKRPCKHLFFARPESIFNQI